MPEKHSHLAFGSKSPNSRKLRVGALLATSLAIGGLVGSRVNPDPSAQRLHVANAQPGLLYESAFAKANAVSKQLNATIKHPDKPVIFTLLNGNISFKKNTQIETQTALAGDQLYTPFVLLLGNKAKNNDLSGSLFGVANNNIDGSIKIDIVAFNPETMEFVPHTPGLENTDGSVDTQPTFNEPVFAGKNYGLEPTPGITSIYQPTQYASPGYKPMEPPYGYPGTVANPESQF